MAGTKNNPGARQAQRRKMYQGKEIKPCLYVGRSVGKGTYMSGSVDGVTILDNNDMPMPYHSIPVDNI